VTAIMLGNSMSLVDIVNAQRDMWFVMIQPVGAILFIIITLAEVNRAPFDMPEAEQELTAGYHSEYSGMKFALFFMAEYEKMIIVCAIAATFFFGGYREFWFLKDTFLSVDQTWWLGPIYLFLKIVVLLFLMIWVRATLPRIRYDRLMAFGWKVTLPLSLAVVFFTAVGILLAKEVAPVYIWVTPVLSIIAALFTVVMIHNALRRKLYERA
jgi:NADH-quinone oxidoreductase subunit H